MDRVKGFFGVGDGDGSDASSPSGAAAASSPPATDAERGMLAEALDASTLSWTTRLQGFAACFVTGLLIAVLAVLMFSLTLNLVTFSILYTLGNVMALASTLFLMGPAEQLKRMFAGTRLTATLLMLLFLALTLMAAFWWKSKLLTLMFCLCQFLAMVWYAISYIPFARDAIKKFFDGILG